MTPPSAIDSNTNIRRLRIAVGVLLLGLGLLGHVLAARAIGGSAIAYEHHILGFFLILAVTGAIILAVGWRYWRSRRDLALLVVGAVQAAFGLWIYIQRFHVR